MQRDLGFGDTLYGAGAGLFFLGALIAQVPSNMILARVGARRTIAGLMVFWGCISAAMTLIHTPAAFLTLRFLLGVAEAGFYPGVIFYLTLWLPRRVRTSFIAWFLFAIPTASILGGPLSTWILQHGHIGRFADWQVLLATEALPAILIGSLLPWLMTDTPDTARWLSDDERLLLQQARVEDEPATEAGHALGWADVQHVVLFAAIYFAMQFGLYAQSFWLPRILEGLGVAKPAIGWHVSIVYALAAVLMLVWGRLADSAPTRAWTLAAPLLLAAIGYAGTAESSRAIVLVMLAFSLGCGGALAATPPFWAQVTLGQRPAAIAAMIALINALGNIGGFAGPTVLGRLHERTGGYAGGMLLAGGALAVAALAFVMLRPSPALSSRLRPE